MNIKFLRIPLNKLRYIEDIHQFQGLNKEEIASFVAEYDDVEIQNIVESVIWATENPDYDFVSLLLPPKLTYTNEEIYKYLYLLKKSFSTL